MHSTEPYNCSGLLGKGLSPPETVSICGVICIFVCPPVSEIVSSQIPSCNAHLE